MGGPGQVISRAVWTTGERLHGIYQSEIVDERDRFYLGMLKQLGIEKDKSFEPDPRTPGDP